MKAIFRFLPLLPLVGAAHAATALITPTAVNFTGTAVEFFATETNLINSAGLSATPTFANYTTITHAAAATGNAWVTNDPGAAGGDFFADTSATVVFTFSLDNTYLVDSLVNWSYNNGGTGNAVKTVTLDFSTNGGSSYDSTISGITVAANATNATTSTFTGTQANFIRMTVTDNYFGAGGGDRVGLSEVRFLGDAVPEPSAALLGGLGASLLLRRRRA